MVVIKSPTFVFLFSFCVRNADCRAEDISAAAAWRQFCPSLTPSFSSPLLPCTGWISTLGPPDVALQWNHHKFALVNQPMHHRRRAVSPNDRAWSSWGGGGVGWSGVGGGLGREFEFETARIARVKELLTRISLKKKKPNSLTHLRFKGKQGY